ncbi:MerR family transcriptional regulator [Amycolatopsis alkalitolerans]|uniref:MerR family transcriptional regulator n=1 Tax=Amycolatopsis alkalitolerans TaxID=2547244 RepID=A0A5C4M3W8_9PSEU|nr:MerR family transcriptional regulator [Amycolatopsis alkalitolerans]TNC27287.1 MerR family transcriptional regulator [Amycolatopsis alkalitolerans]
MGLLTIGAFARAARLSPKALRLYDELGLLRPVSVDPFSGYRFYSPEQLERARLVAWLRRLGMPLARIKTVCELENADAAREIAVYWQEVEAEVRSRARLASFLIEQLSRKEAIMSSSLTMRYAARADRGLVRESNQDVAYAGPHLLAVADGFGAESEEHLASAAAIDALKPLDATVPAGQLLNALSDAVESAGSAVRELGENVGTTLTAMLWSGSQLALVHIGDSRVYLLREGQLSQITQDHTVVQSMIDEGRLTPAEAASHPQRALLVKALHGGEAAQPDVELRDAEPGDRYLLCSDGLYTALTFEALREIVTGIPDPAAAVRELVERANRGGGADNVACVVADVA